MHESPPVVYVIIHCGTHFSKSFGGSRGSVFSISSIAACQWYNSPLVSWTKCQGIHSRCGTVFRWTADKKRRR